MLAWTIIPILEAVHPHSNLRPVFPGQGQISHHRHHVGNKLRETDGKKSPRDQRPETQRTTGGRSGPCVPRLFAKSWTMFKQTLHFPHYLCFSHHENNLSFSKKKKKLTKTLKLYLQKSNKNTHKLTTSRPAFFIVLCECYTYIFLYIM